LTSDICNTSALEFTPVTLGQLERVEAIRSASGSTLYVYAFASLFAWQEHEQYSLCLSDDAFLVKYGARGENAYLFPCGTEAGKKRFIDQLLQSGTPVFYYVSDADRRFLETEYEGVFEFSDRRDDYPYLYDKDEQIALDGKDFKSLRHQVHLGRDVAREWTCEPLDAGNTERAAAINRRWLESRADGGLADVPSAEIALEHFSELPVWGMLFAADGEDVAYVLGTFITPRIFDISFCKVLDNRCDCFIKWALYRALPAEVTSVDSEEDMGLAGLRTHKLLRRPKELVRVWKGTTR